MKPSLIRKLAFVFVASLLIVTVWAQTTTASNELIVTSSSMGEMIFDVALSTSGGNKSHISCAFETLLKQNDDGTVGPGLATAWRQSEDGREWTFDIRAGVKFHDGSTLSAEDVAWTLRRNLLEEGYPGAMGATIYKKLIDSVEAKGNQVIIRTKKPNSDVHFWMGEQSGGGPATVIYPKEYIKKVGVQGFRKHPIGTGPWMFKELVRGQYIKFEAFDDYWREAPKFKYLTMLLVPELSTRLAMLKTDTVDIIEASVTVAKELKDAGLGTIGANAAHLATMFPLFQYEPGHPFNDKRVRQAVSMAIDRNGIINSLYVGQGQPSTNFWGPGCYGFPKDAKPHPYDPKKAKQLLKEAGYPDGFDTLIYTYEDSADMPYLPEQAEMMASYLEAIGLPTKVKILEWGALKDKLGRKGRNYRKIPKTDPVPLFLRAVDSRPQAVDFYKIFYQGGFMYELVAQPDLDELIIKASSAKDTDKAEKLWIEVGMLAQKEYYHLPTVRVDGVFGYNPKTVAGWKTLPGQPNLHRLDKVIPVR
ncbi:ABC transporter substrate-binding protein [Thermodesulfobacteriota bacterium]